MAPSLQTLSKNMGCSTTLATIWSTERFNWRRQRRVTTLAFSFEALQRPWIDMADVVYDILRGGNRQTEQRETIHLNYGVSTAQAMISRRKERYQSFTSTCVSFGSGVGGSIWRKFMAFVRLFLDLFLPHGSCPPPP